MSTHTFESIDQVFEADMSFSELHFYDALRAAFNQPEPHMYKHDSLKRKFRRLADKMTKKIIEGGDHVLVKAGTKQGEILYRFSEDFDTRKLHADNDHLQKFADTRYEIYAKLRKALDLNQKYQFTRNNLITYFNDMIEVMLEKKIIQEKGDRYYLGRKLSGNDGHPGGIMFNCPGYYASDNKSPS